MAADADSPEISRFDSLVRRYPAFLRGQRGLSENTVRVYLDDLSSFREYLAREGLGLTDMDRQMLRGYLAWLATAGRGGTHGYARVSIARKLTVLRSFYLFLVQEGLFLSSPVPSGRSFRVKVQKPLPQFLGQKEVERLLGTPDESTAVGIRDRAILEVLYSCGVRLGGDSNHGPDPCELFAEGNSGKRQGFQGTVGRVRAARRHGIAPLHR